MEDGANDPFDGYWLIQELYEWCVGELPESPEDPFIHFFNCRDCKKKFLESLERGVIHIILLANSEIINYMNDLHEGELNVGYSNS